MIQKPRGTADVMPEESVYWQLIEKKARQVSARFGFGEVRIPTFEVTELYQRGVGGTTDVVQKEMYTFLDREGRSLTLRPEGTAGVVRALLENGRCSDPMPLKYYYITNCFRYEKPQAGRYREFFQFGVEMFGAAAPAADAEIILLADTLLKELGVKDVSLHINSIGCPDCRPAYREALRTYFRDRAEALCPTCRERLETNPLRILDCKNPPCAEIAAGAPKTVDSLCPACMEHKEKLEAYLNAAGVAFTVDPHIVRGLDYYTRTVFEFIAPVVGAQSTVCGGGRYDGLVKELGGPQMPGIGFGMGINRLILAMKGSGIEAPTLPAPTLYIASLGQAASVKAMEIVTALRRAGIAAACDLTERSLKAQMKYADKLGARFTLLLGDGELEAGKAQLRDMKTGQQTEWLLDDTASLEASLSGKE